MISSRTPEGEPGYCSICGTWSRLEAALPYGDACCPRCGQLVIVVRRQLRYALGIAEASIELNTAFRELGADSLGIVEFVMALEEETGINIPETDAEQLRTIADVIRYLNRQQNCE